MSQRSPKAEGMSWVTPCLIVKDVEAALAFYSKAFGFETTFSMPDQSGRTVHAHVEWQGQTIMLGREGACPGSVTKTPKSSGVPSPVGCYVYVPDVDSFFARAKAAGAVVISEPEDAFWGDRFCRLQDLDGHDWNFATNVKDWDPSQGTK
jgi:uncharacterized glyoxalase superfamily protein PhnB